MAEAGWTSIVVIGAPATVARDGAATKCLLPRRGREGQLRESSLSSGTALTSKAPRHCLEYADSSLNHADSFLILRRRRKTKIHQTPVLMGKPEVPPVCRTGGTPFWWSWDI